MLNLQSSIFFLGQILLNEREKRLYSLCCGSLSLGVPTREVSWGTTCPLSDGGKWPEDCCMPLPRIRISTSLSLCFLFNFKVQKAISNCPHLWELSSEYWTYWKTMKSREGLSGIQLNCRGDTAQILQRNSKARNLKGQLSVVHVTFFQKLSSDFFPSDPELKTLFLTFLFRSLRFIYFKYFK